MSASPLQQFMASLLADHNQTTAPDIIVDNARTPCFSIFETHEADRGVAIIGDQRVRRTEIIPRCQPSRWGSIEKTRLTLPRSPTSATALLFNYDTIATTASAMLGPTMISPTTNGANAVRMPDRPQRIISPGAISVDRFALPACPQRQLSKESFGSNDSIGSSVVVEGNTIIAASCRRVSADSGEDKPLEPTSQSSSIKVPPMAPILGLPKAKRTSPSSPNERKKPTKIRSSPSLLSSSAASSTPMSAYNRCSFTLPAQEPHLSPIPVPTLPLGKHRVSQTLGVDQTAHTAPMCPQRQESRQLVLESTNSVQSLMSNASLVSDAPIGSNDTDEESLLSLML